MKSPNILIVVLDTVRAANLSCYGYPLETTPNLERFAGEGVICELAFAPGMWTIPSHASLFTGTYPAEHGALNLHRHLSGRFPTLAQLLSDAGYDTVAFSNNSFISLSDFGLGRGFDVLEGHGYPRGILKKVLARGWQTLAGTVDCGAFQAGRFLSSYLRRRRGEGKPWFAFVNLMEAHAPYRHLPRRSLQRFLSSAERRTLRRIDQDTQRFLTGTSRISEAEFEILRATYDAQIRYLDGWCGGLFRMLSARGLWDDTLVVVTADHGDLIGEHGLVHHSYALYEELLRIPLIVKHPGRTSNGSPVGHLVSLLDLFPTVLETAGVEPALWRGQARGTSLLEQRALAAREQLFFECERPKNEFAETYPGFDFAKFDRQLLAVRTRRHKYIWASDGRHELYDLEADPRESRNLIGTQAVLQRGLHELLFAWRDGLESAAPSGEGDPPVELSQEVQRHLKALGYF